MEYNQSNQRMKRTRQCLILLLLLLNSVIMVNMLSCASKAEPSSQNEAPITKDTSLPSVYLNPSEKYPEDRFLAASGSGDSITDAQQDALASLSRMIKVDVQSTLSLVSSEASSERNNESSFETSTALDNRINTSTNQQFIGVQYGDSYNTNDGLVYTIAYINRLTVGNIYREGIAATNKEINTLVKDANQATGFSKYAKLSKALDLSVYNDAQVEQLQVIAPAMAGVAQSQSQVSSTSIEQALTQTAREITLSTTTSVVGGGDTVQSKIENNVIDLFTDLRFTVLKNGSSAADSTNNAIVVNTLVNWEEQTHTKYPTIAWTLNLSIIDDGRTIISSTQEGQSKGNSIPSAQAFAFADIKKAILKNTKYAILNQIQ